MRMQVSQCNFFTTEKEMVVEFPEQGIAVLINCCLEYSTCNPKLREVPHKGHREVQHEGHREVQHEGYMHRLGILSFSVHDYWRGNVSCTICELSQNAFFSSRELQVHQLKEVRDTLTQQICGTLNLAPRRLDRNLA